ncbi:MAG: SprT-like domain-containing protein [Ginsengibacter sp.]
MPKAEAPLQHLARFIPEAALPKVVDYLNQYKVHLTITRERQSLLGDYRNNHLNRNHRISVNGNLNKFSFLITLLHELAHLLAFEKFSNRISPHGKEWKKIFGFVLSEFLSLKIFPDPVEEALLHTLHNPSASSCGDVKLTRVLQQYDLRKPGVNTVEEIPAEGLFRIKGGRIFKRQNKVRTRYKCLEVATGKLYLFSPVYEVQIISDR